MPDVQVDAVDLAHEAGDAIERGLVPAPVVAVAPVFAELLDDVQNELLAPLSPAERQQLIHLLTRVLERHA